MAIAALRSGLMVRRQCDRLDLIAAGPPNPLLVALIIDE
jgi:hypothetical protein